MGLWSAFWWQIARGWWLMKQQNLSSCINTPSGTMACPWLIKQSDNTFTPRRSTGCCGTGSNTRILSKSVRSGRISAEVILAQSRLRETSSVLPGNLWLNLARADCDKNYPVQNANRTWNLLLQKFITRNLAICHRKMSCQDSIRDFLTQWIAMLAWIWPCEPIYNIPHSYRIGQNDLSGSKSPKQSKA